MRSLVLVGPMGAGKTSIGKKVAKILGRSFIDTDAVVVRENGPIPDIFASHGEGRFRELEQAAVAASVSQGAVVALGGGAVLNPDTRDLLSDHDVVLLTVSPRIVAARLAGGAGRPMLAGEEDPMTRWVRIRDERMPHYHSVADATFDTSTGRIQSVADDIAAWVRRRNA